MNVHLTLKSANAKVGPIPVSTSESATCPKTCGEYKACYAKLGPMLIHWRHVDNGTRGTSWDKFCTAIANLPIGQFWRHNQAGDLPGVDNDIDTAALAQLVDANKGKKGFTYTHKNVKTQKNADAIKSANKNGFTINLSADNVAMADDYKTLNLGPVVVVLPSVVSENFVTPKGNKVVICPAVTHESVTCVKCKLCAWKDRDVIIGFPAHGGRKKLIDIALGALDNQSNL